jgi:hypothetical protein
VRRKRPPRIRATGASTVSPTRRRPVQRERLDRLGNRAVETFRCASAPCRRVAQSPGKLGGGAKPAVREPRAVRSNVLASGNRTRVAAASWRGRLMHEVGFVGWATDRRRRSRSMGDPCSGLVRSRGQPRERMGSWLRGPWMGPAESSGKLGGAARFAKNRATEFRGGVRREGNFARNEGADRL